MTRDELIAALAAAPEGSRELDFWCWWYGLSTEAAKSNPMPPDPDYVRDKLDEWTNGPSRSVDWALKLIPAGWVIPLNHGLHQSINDGKWSWGCALAPRGAHGPGWVHIDWTIMQPATPALALCIVALMARREIQRGAGGHDTTTNPAKIGATGEVSSTTVAQSILDKREPIPRGGVPDGTWRCMTCLRLFPSTTAYFRHRDHCHGCNDRGGWTLHALGILAGILLLLGMLLMGYYGSSPNSVRAAQLQGRYVQLLAVTNDGLISVVHDLTPAGCAQVIDTMRAEGLDSGYKKLECLPIDYARENRR